MTPVPAIQSASSLIMQLANPAVRALVLAGATGLGLALLRVKNISVRLFTWTAILYAAIAMPLLGWMLPPLSVPTPAFLQHRLAQTLPDSGGDSQSNSVSSASSGGSDSGKLVAPVSSSSSEVSSTTSTSHAFSIRWSTLAAGIYFAVASLLLVRFFVGLAFSRRLMRGSQKIEDPRVTRRLDSSAHAFGLGMVPSALESEFVSVPVTMGALRSAILLPSCWRDWDDAKLDAVVVHEMSHIARRDALTQRLSLLHRTIFWFSPLAWWLDRHLADLAEEASDEAALSCGADSRDYARTLLGFFEALHTAPGRVWWQGVSMAKAGQAEQRVERILAWEGNAAMSLKKSIAAAVIVLAVPAAYLAASVNPSTNNPVSQGLNFLQGQGQDQSAGQAQASTSAASAQAASAAQSQSASESTHSKSTRRHSSGSGSSYSGNSYSYGYDDDQRFVMVSGNSDSLTMSGSTEDATHAQKLKKQIPGDFIWFESDEKSYVIRDQATIDRARKFWAPQEELGKKQEELGKQQEALGKQQEALGAQMEKVHVEVPDMTAQLDALKAKMKELNSGATMDQVGQIQSEIGELQSKIGDLQSLAGDQQSKLGDQMGELGEKQGKLGEQQGELGRQQGELGRQASHQMKQLLDEAIKKGIAQPEI